MFDPNRSCFDLIKLFGFHRGKTFELFSTNLPKLTCPSVCKLLHRQIFCIWKASKNLVQVICSPEDSRQGPETFWIFRAVFRRWPPEGEHCWPLSCAEARVGAVIPTGLEAARYKDQLFSPNVSSK